MLNINYTSKMYKYECFNSVNKLSNMARVKSIHLMHSFNIHNMKSYPMGINISIA